MKKHFIQINIALLILVLSFFSCKKFLDLKPISSITTENAYTTAPNIEAALNGAYSSFMGTNYYQWQFIELSDMHSDNAYNGGGGDATFLPIDLLNIPSDNNGCIYLSWTELYASIAKCNVVIDNVVNVTDPALTNERRTQIIGEASFLRAFHYYQLVKQWGGVPIEKHSNSTDPSVIRIPRSADTAVYNFIVSDLAVALNNLPDAYDGADGSTNKVRATKGAANALLAKVWAQRPDRDYNKVLQYCNAVINSPAGYSLMTNYADLFDGNHPFNDESIMEIPYVAGTPEGCWGTELIYPTHQDDGTISSDAWQRYCVPSKTLVNAYTTAHDAIRENAKISFEYAPWPDINWNPCGDPTIKIPFDVMQKNPDNYAGGDHVYLLRLADIILLKAEAQNETGDVGGAATTLNEVRSRVHLPATNATSQTAMRAAILTERQLELSFEAQRWDDLVRSGTVVTVMNNLNESNYTCNNGTPSAPIPINYNMNTQKELLPIPLLELQANPNLTQNPGY